MVLADAASSAAWFGAWVNLAIFAVTAVAAGAAVAVYVHDKKEIDARLTAAEVERDNQRERAIREQAEAVCVWRGPVDKTTRAGSQLHWDIGAYVLNDSRLPIYDVRVIFSFGEIEGQAHEWAIGPAMGVRDYIAPQKFVDSVEETNRWLITVRLHFRDAAERLWERGPTGSLTLLEERP